MARATRSQAYAAAGEQVTGEAYDRPRALLRDLLHPLELFDEGKE